MIIDVRVVAASIGLFVTLLCLAFVAGVNVTESLILRGKIV